MSFLTRWDEGGFFAEFAGVVSAWEIEAVNNEFTGSAKFDAARFALWDMSGITQLNMDTSDVEDAAATDKGASVVRQSLRGAIVVSEGPVRKMVEHYLAVSGELENTWDTRLFPDLESARRWLGI